MNPEVPNHTRISLNELVHPALAANAPVGIGVSGGKDGSAAAWLTKVYLNAIGHTGPLLLIHSDLGRIEHRDSLPTCQRLADKLQLELVVVRREQGGMIERWRERWENNLRRYLDLSCVKMILPWSTPGMRFCTSELKTRIITQELTRRFAGQRIVSVTGIRGEESANRMAQPVAEEMKELFRKPRKGAPTSGIAWRPIHHYRLDDVWTVHRHYNLPVHEAYSQYNMTRVSCSFCIMSSLEDLINSAKMPGNDAIYRELVDLEIDSTFQFQSSRWLGDVNPHLLSEEQLERLEVAKHIADSRQQLEALIPEHLLYVKGWPTQLPTYSEAKLLADIRRAIGDDMALLMNYITPETVMERYEELLSKKQSKPA